MQADVSTGTLSSGTPLLWSVFTLILVIVLAIDLGIFNRQAREHSFQRALLWSVVWVGLALLFDLWIYFRLGDEKALEFLTGYVIEKSLSVDNIFVFLVVFSYFRVPASYQHRILFFGIVGALLMRGIFIFAGAGLVAQFHWIIYIFGILLVITGAKMLRHDEVQVDPERNSFMRLARKLIPSTDTMHGERFFVVENGRHLATPLFFVLLFIEFTDVVFAIDSIPAIFAITTDVFIVFTSNIFAILGLRALFFMLSGALTRIKYLRFGLAAILCFVGVKMLVAEHYPIPIGISLSVIAGILLVAVAASFLATRVKPAR